MKKKVITTLAFATTFILGYAFKSLTIKSNNEQVSFKKVIAYTVKIPILIPNFN